MTVMHLNGIPKPWAHQTAFATELVHKLRRGYRQGGFLHFGQRRDVVPRQAVCTLGVGIYWRADGQRVAQPDLFADERMPSHYTSEHGKIRLHLARKLGVDGQHITAGLKDTWYYLWRERRLPGDVDPLTPAWKTRWSVPSCAASSPRPQASRGLRAAAQSQRT
jgi:uncharacterized protein (DUF2126 family)